MSRRIVGIRRMIVQYRCRWCHKCLKPARRRGLDWLLLLLLVRPYKCPHCLERRLRPLV